MKFQKKFGISIVILTLCFSIIFVYISWLISSYSVNPFIPQSKQTKIPITLNFPLPSNGVLSDIAVTVDFNLEANSTISEGIDLKLNDIEAKAYNNNPIGYNIDDMWIGFRHTESSQSFADATFPLTRYYEALDGAWIFKNRDESFRNNEFTPFKIIKTTTFNFPAAGDYSPSLIIGLVNQTYLTATYDDIKIHVLSESELQTQELNHISAIIAIVLLVLAFVEAVAVLKDLLKDENTCYQYSIAWK